ncbi:MAG: hypothetical protein FRX48_02100 [Lasallia pustulata]|uniref:Mediator of RNA polymerase II transcription subunit 1 n=1 Tax=Lasallia pustulata TaxID=136370 RepID=A0A5M8PXB2_9LECA|nr:MAG: hypothetical protein FRX48_02100 [Lasallia pustulata]
MATPTTTPKPPSKQTPRPSTSTAPTPAAVSSPANAPTTSSTGHLRSVPSPAYLHQHASRAGKSPYTHGIGPTSTPATAVASSPAGPGVTGALGPASVSTAGNVGTPGLSGLGLGLGIGIGMERTGTSNTSVGTGPNSNIGVGITGSMSLGGAEDSVMAGTSIIGGSTNVRDNEAERNRRIERIVDVLGQQWGLVSQEGVERAARRCGLECLWEEGPAAGARTLSIAGNAVLVDVEFVEEEIIDVVLSLPGCVEAVGVHWGGRKGADVLKKDLRGEEGKAGYVGLEAFIKNLERLARLDRLSADGVNCFEALEGVRSSLHKLYTYDVKEVREQRQERLEVVDREVILREVISQRYGRLVMHGRGHVGLTSQYWMERRLVLESKTARDEMLGVRGKDEYTLDDEEGPKIYSAGFECEASSAQLYPPIRVSDAWISDHIDKDFNVGSLEQHEWETGENPFLQGGPIEWLEPPSTLASTADISGHAMVLDAGPLQAGRGKEPNVRFVVKLDPPIIMPLQTAARIYSRVGVPVPEDLAQPATYPTLLFAHNSEARHAIVMNGEVEYQRQHYGVTRSVKSYRGVGGRELHESMHKYTLFSQQRDMARALQQIPFSHPKQIVEIMPVLRQWALVGDIIRRTFGRNDIDDKSEIERHQKVQDHGFDSEQGLSAEEELDALMAMSEDEDDEEDGDNISPLAVDVSLSISPVPAISLLFESHGDITSVTFNVGPNGSISARDLVLSGRKAGGEGDPEKKTKLTREEGKLERVLSIAEDLGAVVEWMRE